MCPSVHQLSALFLYFCWCCGTVGVQSPDRSPTTAYFILSLYQVSYTPFPLVTSHTTTSTLSPCYTYNFHATLHRLLGCLSPRHRSVWLETKGVVTRTVGLFYCCIELLPLTRTNGLRQSAVVPRLRPRPRINGHALTSQTQCLVSTLPRDRLTQSDVIFSAITSAITSRDHR